MYISVNQCYSDIVGIDPAEFIGHRVRDFFPMAADKVEMDIQMLDQNIEIPGHEIVVNQVPYLVSVRGIRDDGGAVIGLSVALTNILKQKKFEEELSAAIRELSFFAATDPLTNLPNRRSFDRALREEVSRGRRDRLSLALLMIDVDHFKAYNDRYGHPAGDECLQSVAGAINLAIRRPGDLPSRIGGEEFAVILPATDLEGARVVAAAIQRSIADLALTHDGSPFAQVTVSIGIGDLGSILIHDEGAEHAALFQMADRALYTAKNAGRNIVRACGEV